jgi:hypothetical protein
MANTLTYGFLSLQDLYTQRVNQVGVARVYQAVKESVDEYNRVRDAMMARFMERTILAKEQIELPSSGTLQPLSADGNPLPMVASGKYDVAYPIRGAGVAWGTNRISREMLTLQEADRFTDSAFQQDADWVIRHALAAIFDNVSYNFVDEVGPSGGAGLGTIAVQPLANSDSVVYTRRGGTAATTDTHYLAQAGGVADITNPFVTLRSELVEHPSNTGPLVAYIPTNLVADVGNLAEFVEVADPDINYFNDNANTGPAEILGPGDEIIGKLKSSNFWIVEWSRLPSSYILAASTGAGPFVKMREYQAPSLQGLFTEGFNEDGNHMGQRFLRYAGFGVSNRVAAAVMRVGNASYAIPTGYDAPLAV